MNRPTGEVPFADNVWVKRYKDSNKWVDIRTSQAEQELRKFIYPENWDNQMRNAKEGGYFLYGKYAVYAYLKKPTYHDEIGSP